MLTLKNVIKYYTWRTIRDCRNRYDDKEGIKSSACPRWPSPSVFLPSILISNDRENFFLDLWMYVHHAIEKENKM